MNNHIRHSSIGIFLETSPWNLSHSPSAPHALSCWLVLPYWVLIHRRHSNWIVSFTASFASSLSHSLHHSLTYLSCHDSHLLHHISISHQQHHLISHHQHSTTLTNTRPLPATLSSLYDILTLTKQTSPNHPTSYILHYRSLTVQLHHFTSKQQTCKLHHSLTSFHSTSRSPHLHFTIASNQLHLCFTPIAPSKSITHTPPNPPIDPTPITTPTLQTTPFPLPSQQT